MPIPIRTRQNDAIPTGSGSTTLVAAANQAFGGCISQPIRYNVVGGRRGLINYIGTKAKCRHLKNWSVKGLCGRCFICLRPPPLLWPHTGKVGRGGGGGDQPETRLAGKKFTKLGRKYQHDWLYLQSINPDKHLPSECPLTWVPPYGIRQKHHKIIFFLFCSVIWPGGREWEPGESAARDGGGSLGGRLLHLPRLLHAPTQVRLEIFYVCEPTGPW